MGVGATNAENPRRLRGLAEVDGERVVEAAERVGISAVALNTRGRGELDADGLGGVGPHRSDIERTGGASAERSGSPAGSAPRAHGSTLGEWDDSDHFAMVVQRNVSTQILSRTHGRGI